MKHAASCRCCHKRQHRLSTKQSTSKSTHLHQLRPDVQASGWTMPFSISSWDRGSLYFCCLLKRYTLGDSLCMQLLMAFSAQRLLHGLCLPSRKELSMRLDSSRHIHACICFASACTHGKARVREREGASITGVRQAC